ncbi:MAG: hypothetical protein J6Y77_05065 [Paludibacteraceae bacterium]|nr:hypothetical protein [Paludibacteraceae bacterium]
MKNRFLILIGLCVAGIAATQAQTIYEAASQSAQDLGGTARFLGSGGAFNAIGGEVSTISYNPAGLAVYASDELTATVNIQWANSRFEQQQRMGWPTATLANAAYIKTFKTDRERGLVSWNIAFSYNAVYTQKRRASYAGNTTRSFADFLAAYSEGLDETMMNYEEEDAGWASVLAYDAGLIVPNGASSWKSGAPEDESANNFYYEENGHNNEFAISFGTNFNHQWYAGLSLAGNYLNYALYSQYSEQYSDRTFINERTYNANGVGFTCKLGLLYKPVKWIRLGLAFHTPGLYVNKDKASTCYKSDLYWYGSPGYDTFYRYRLRTPLRASASLGIHLGKYGIFGLEYQFSNTQNIRIGHHSTDAINVKINRYLLDQHTVRAGLEIKPFTWFALRAGAGYTSPFTGKYPQDALQYNDTDTEIGYYHDYGSYFVSAGFGFKFNIQYIDFAYIYQANRGEYHPYNAHYSGVGGGELNIGDVCLPFRSVRNQIVFTYGLKF